MSTRRNQRQKSRRLGSGKKYRHSKERGGMASDTSPAAARLEKRLEKPGTSGESPLRESARVEALTVAWMLVVISGLMSEAVASVTLLWHWLARPSDVATAAADTATITDFLGVVAIITLFVAIALSPINLLLTMVLRRMRREQPPRAVVTAALMIALLPIPLWLFARVHFGN